MHPIRKHTKPGHHKHTKPGHHLILAAAAGLVASAGQAAAGPLNWAGAAGTDDWHTAANWLENAIPTAADDVLIGRLPAPLISNVLVNADAAALSLTLEGGHTLIVNSSLTVAGPTVVSAGPASLAIGQVGTLTTGTLDVNGLLRVPGGRLIVSGAAGFAAGTDAIVDTVGELRIGGATTFAGGMFSGTGAMTLLGNTLVTGNASVGVATFDLDGDPALNTAQPSIEITPGATLTINSTRFSLGANPSDFTGRLIVRGGLSVTGMTNWVLADTLSPTRLGTLELAGGTVTGAHITNHGIITGHGTIATLNVINNTAITASGGTLVLSTLSFPDIDGFGPKGETGIVNALDGDVRITTNQGSSHRFNGTLNIGPGRTFSMDFFGLNNSGVMNLPAGARYAAPRFSQTDTGTLNLTINGTGPAEKGMVVASGIVTVGGRLNLSVGPGVTLARGQGVRLMTAQTVTGAFHTVTGIDQAQKGYFVYADNRAVGVGSLAYALAQPGDANFDGRVDSGDLLTVVPFFNNVPAGVNATWGQGDFEEDGDVDSRDLLAASPFYNQGLYVQFIDTLAAGPAAAAAPRPAASPIPQPLKESAAPDGFIEYDAATGRLTLHPGEGELSLFVLRSSAALFHPAAALLPGQGSFTTTTKGELSQFFFAPLGAGGWDLGAVLPAGLPRDLITDDLIAFGGSLGRPVFSLDLIHTPAVPEPAALLAGGSAVLALRRRRR